MDRGRCFSILGLSQTATKNQVEAAYARKVARYKGPDYAEEPAYVERKLSQLYQAYQEALSLAADGSSTYQPSYVERNAEKPAKRKPAKASRLLEDERDAAEHNVREKFHQWMERRDDKKQKRKAGNARELPRLTKPDFSKLKNKLQEIKEEVATQLELNSSDEESVQEYLVTEQIEDDDFADATIHTAPVSDSKKNEKIGSIISIVVALVIFLIGACDGSSEPDYSYDEEDIPSYSYIYDEDWEIITEEDEHITVLADDSYYLLTENENNSTATTYDEVQSDYQEQAELFVKNYFGKDSVDAVADYLYDQYPSFYIEEEDSMSTKLDAIFAFYGFIELDSAIWYNNPYTGGPIEGYGDYLDYLNQFYEEQ